MTEILKFAGPVVLAHVVVFAVVILLIKRLLLNTTLQAVDTVRQVETEVRKKEASVVRQIEEHEKNFARERAEAEEKLERQRRQSEKEIAQAREKMIEEAREESDRIIKRAKQEEENMRRLLESGMEDKAMQYAGEILGMIFSEENFGALDAVLVDEIAVALSEMETDSITIDGEEADFRTARPLESAQRQKLQSLIAEKFGREAEVKEKVDEDLLGGLILKIGSLEIDASLRHRIEEAREVLRKDRGA